MTVPVPEPDTHDPLCLCAAPDRREHHSYCAPNCAFCQCALIAKVEQRGREMERAERLACICDRNPTTTDGPSEDCPQHGRPYVEAYDGGYRAGRADALDERGVGEPLDADAVAAFIRQIDGDHSMGAGALGEAIAERFAARSAAPELTLAQLEALPVGSVVLDIYGRAWQRTRLGQWVYSDLRWDSGELHEIAGPVRLLHRGVN